MKYFLLILGFSVLPFFVKSQNTNNNLNKLDTTKKIIVAEAGCGQCQFGLPGKSCNLAVRMDGHAYFVIGADIDAYGDAHENDGFCKAVKKARVQGELSNNQFILTYFELLKN